MNSYSADFDVYELSVPEPSQVGDFVPVLIRGHSKPLAILQVHAHLV